MANTPQSKPMRAQKQSAPAAAEPADRPIEPIPAWPGTPGSKIDTVIALLRRSGGASLNEMVAATGWLPHTTRAALTGLKKKGHVICSEKMDGVRRYSVSKPQ